MDVDGRGWRGRSRLGILSQLRAVYGGDWRAVRSGFGWEWHGPIGVVRAYSHLLNRYDGDEASDSVYVTDSGETVGAFGVIFGKC